MMTERSKIDLPHIALGWNAEAKVGSLENYHYQPSGGHVVVPHQILHWEGKPKVDTRLKSTRPLSEKTGHADIHRIRLPKFIQKRTQKGRFEEYELTPKGAIVVVKKKKVTAVPKVRSLANLDYEPQGGDIKIHDEKLHFDALAKVGSLDNVSHVPGGGNVYIIDDRVHFEGQAKIHSLDNIKYQPSGGEVQITTHKLKWDVKPKVGSLGNVHYQPTTNNPIVFSERLKWETSPRVNSLENATYTPSGGNVKIPSSRVHWQASSKIGSLENKDYVIPGGYVAIINSPPRWKIQPKINSRENINYEPSGGDGVRIINERLEWKADPVVNSLEKVHYTPSKPARRRIRFGAYDRTVIDDSGHVKLDGETESSGRTTWQAQPKINTRENIMYKPSGGDGRRIINEKLEWKADPVVNSLEQVHYTPSKPARRRIRFGAYDRTVIDDSGHVTLDGETESSGRTTWQAQPKINTRENITYKPSGGDVSIKKEKLEWKAAPVVNSLEKVHYTPKKPTRKRIQFGAYDSTVISEYGHVILNGDAASSGRSTQ